MTGTGHGAAHAKLILFGEHVVLYGNPAIAMPVPALRVTATARRRSGRVRVDFAGAGPEPALGRIAVADLDAGTIPRLAAAVTCDRFGWSGDGIGVEIHSDIPVGRGLGSSAALAAAVIESVASLHDTSLTPDQHFELIQHCETVTHGKASGIDARTVAHTSGPVWFQSGAVRPLELTGRGDTVLLVVDTGVFASTHQAVALVGERIAALGTDAAPLLDRAADLTEAAAQDLAAARPVELGAKMTETQHLLDRLGVSCPAIDEVITAARDVGVWGAKLSGGGLGGCVIAVGDHAATTRLTTALAPTPATVVARIPLGEP